MEIILTYWIVAGIITTVVFVTAKQLNSNDERF